MTSCSGPSPVSSSDSSQESIASSISDRDTLLPSDTDSPIPSYDVDSQSNTLFHILLLGQSLSMGYATKECLSPCTVENAYMFNHVRTQDLGYQFGITQSEYAVNSEAYEAQLYTELKPLREEGGYGSSTHKWESASDGEYETPCTGIVEGLCNAYQKDGRNGLPYSVLVSAPGIGGTPITGFNANSKIYDRTVKDIENGKRLAEAKGMNYQVLAFFWMQGEAEAYQNYRTEWYQNHLQEVKQLYTQLAVNLTEQEAPPPFITYQSICIGSGTAHVTQSSILAQFRSAVDEKSGIAISAPCYQFETAGDSVHLTNRSTRNIGRLMGQTLYEVLHRDYTVFAPETVTVSGNTATLTFAFPVTFRKEGLLSSHRFAVAMRANGFQCLDAHDEILDCTASVSEDGKTVTLTCDGSIQRIAYGYDPSEKSNQQFSYGGTLCRQESIAGYENEALHLYMPIQDIYMAND